MQANCPQCSHRITIDDARVPDRPFSVKCPKCQTVVKFPGKGAAAPPPSEPPSAAAEPAGDEMRAEMMAQLRREMSMGEGARAEGRVLVALPDRGQAGAFTLPLTRLGYSVDTLDNPEEGGRLLEQGAYKVVVTSRAAPLRGESLYQRMTRLGPDARRRVFLMLVGEDFKTGDGAQAFAALADLVVHPKDSGAVDVVLTNTLGERNRVYQAFQEARKRHEAASVA